MHFPRFWASESTEGITLWRWSDVSFADAKHQATEAVVRVASRFRQGLPLDRYGYGDRPLREPVLREIRRDDGKLAAAITRNATGAEILNTSDAMFVDIDLPQVMRSTPARGGLLGRLLGGLRAPRVTHEPPAIGSATESERVKAIAAWTAQRASWCWRVYRTHSGLRLLATHRPISADDPQVQPIFAELGADPLYRRLCDVQKSFRARLTPKPWRCGWRQHPPRWPWTHSDHENAFEEWHARYRAVAAGFSTCRLLTTLGVGDIHPDLRPIVELHDSATRVASGLPLA